MAASVMYQCMLSVARRWLTTATTSRTADISTGLLASIADAMTAMMFDRISPTALTDIQLARKSTRHPHRIIGSCSRRRDVDAPSTRRGGGCSSRAPSRRSSAHSAERLHSSGSTSSIMTSPQPLIINGVSQQRQQQTPRDAPNVAGSSSCTDCNTSVCLFGAQ